MKTLLRIFAVSAIALAFLGCPEKKGPFEKAGETLDEAADDMGDAIEDAVDDADN